MNGEYDFEEGKESQLKIFEWLREISIVLLTLLLGYILLKIFKKKTKGEQRVQTIQHNDQVFEENIPEEPPFLSNENDISDDEDEENEEWGVRVHLPPTKPISYRDALSFSPSHPQKRITATPSTRSPPSSPTRFAPPSLPPSTPTTPSKRVPFSPLPLTPFSLTSPSRKSSNYSTPQSSSFSFPPVGGKLPLNFHDNTHYIQNDILFDNEEFDLTFDDYQKKETLFTVLFTPPKPLPPPPKPTLPASPAASSPPSSIFPPSSLPPITPSSQPSTPPIIHSPSISQSINSPVNLSIGQSNSPLTQSINQSIGQSSSLNSIPNIVNNNDNAKKKDDRADNAAAIFTRAEQFYKKYREGVPVSNSQDVIKKRLNQITGSFESARRNENFLKTAMDKLSPSQRKSFVIFLIDNLIKSSSISVNKKKYHRCAITILKLLHDAHKDLTILQYLVACLYHNCPYLIPYFEFAVDHNVIGGENEHAVLGRMYFSLLLMFFNEKTPLFFYSDDFHNPQHFKSGSYVAWKFISSIGNRNSFHPANPAVIIRILIEYFEGMSTTLVQQWKKNNANYFLQMREYYEKKFCENIIKPPTSAPLLGLLNDFKNNAFDKFDIHNLDQQTADFTNGIL